MVGCAAINCSNNSRNNKFKFYKFPTDFERRKTWIINCGRKNWSPTPTNALCNVHFEELQFEFHRVHGCKTLKSDAIPTLFDITSKPKLLSTCYRKRKSSTDITMPCTCLIQNCGSKAEENEIPLFKVPALLNFKHDPHLSELSRMRRGKWISAINREDWNIFNLRNGYVCSKHFKTGKPANLEDVDHPDWVPSQNLGSIVKPLLRHDVAEKKLKLPLNPEVNELMQKKDVILYRLSDAEIRFDKICRTCFSTASVKCIFDIEYDNIEITEMLEQHAFIQVSENDKLPKHICDTCILELINCYRFKLRCRQAQLTFEKIVKYNDNRDNFHQNGSSINIPFVVNTIENFSTNQIPSNIYKSAEDMGTNKTKEANSVSTLYQCDNETEYQSDLLKENEIKIENEDKTNGNNNLEDGSVENVEISKFKLRNNKVNLTCSKCHEAFKTSEELKKHRKEVNHPISCRKQSCRVCGKLCANNQLKQHMRTHTKEKPYKCNLCLKAFSLNCNLKRHSMTHTGERPHICDVCGKGFIQAGSLEDHKRIHTGETPFICSYCGETFSQRFKYQRHLREHQISNGQNTQLLKELQCHVCNKAFFSKGSLKTHILIHGEKSYLCSDCGKGFSSNAGLQSHLKVHTGARPYTCADCSKSFTQLGTLKSHKLIHSGQRPFICQICSKSYIQRSHLKYHMRTHGGERPYLCTYCNKSFSLNGTLKVHIRTHTGETPYICDVCNRGFYDSSSMKKHRRGHTDINNPRKYVPHIQEKIGEGITLITDNVLLNI